MVSQVNKRLATAGARPGHWPVARYTSVPGVVPDLPGNPDSPRSVSTLWQTPLGQIPAKTNISLDSL